MWPLLNSGLNSGSTSYCVALDKVFNHFVGDSITHVPSLLGGSNEIIYEVLKKSGDAVFLSWSRKVLVAPALSRCLCALS